MAVAVIGSLFAVLAHGQGRVDRLTFDVASIKLSAPGKRSSGGIKPLPGGYGYTAQNFPVKLMISLMYKVPMRQIMGGPEWLNSDLYDVEARADHAYSIDDLHVMFQNLLADRFNLKLHKEIKEGPVYALKIDPSGLKMKGNETEQDLKIPINPGPNHTFIGTRVPMPYLCWWLGQQVQHEERPVIDKTGLDKNYDFTLSFAQVLPPDVPKENIPPEVQDAPTIFDALNQQLGLQLQAEKGPVEYYVIDRVERPSAN